MKISILNDAEKKVLEAVKIGDKADVQGSEDKKKIRAEFLKRILVSLPLDGQTTKIPITTRGIWIANATIIGDWGLAGWAGDLENASVALPRLFFINCTFEKLIDLRRVHMHSLSLVNCKIPALFANHAKFASMVYIRGTNFTGCKIDSSGKSYALDMRNVQIDGSLFLSSRRQKRFIAKQRVYLEGAVINGDLDISGAKLKGVRDYALTLNGAVIKGRLLLNHKHKKSFEADGGIRMNGIRIQGTFEAKGAKLSGRSGRPALSFDMARIDDGVFLTPAHSAVEKAEFRFEADGGVRFVGADIGGVFDASGARISNNNGYALFFDSAEIGGNVSLEPSKGGKLFTADGGIRFSGAHLKGWFAANGVQLTAIQTPEDIEAYSALRFDNTTIDGNVFFRPASKIYVHEYSNIKPTAQSIKPEINGDISCRYSKIGGAWRSENCTINGNVDMRHASIAVLDSHPITAWPQRSASPRLSKLSKLLNQPKQSESLDYKHRPRLDGLTYDSIKIETNLNDGNELSQTYLNWLKSQFKNPNKPIKEEFRPQPFQQLTTSLRAQGHSDDADTVAIAMRDLRLRSGVDPWPTWLLHRFLGLTCRFGYSGGRASLTLLVWLIIGTIFYSFQAANGAFGPADHVTNAQHVADDNPSEVKSPVIEFVLLKREMIPKGKDFICVKTLSGETIKDSNWVNSICEFLYKPEQLDRGCAGNIAPLYALDAMLPILQMGQRRVCIFDPHGPLADYWQLFHVLYIIIGSIGTAIAIATFAGFMRKE